jgi:hypothetical protein
MLYEPKSNLSALINKVITDCYEATGTYAEPYTTYEEWAELILAWDVLSWAKCYDC